MWEFIYIRWFGILCEIRQQNIQKTVLDARNK